MASVKPAFKTELPWKREDVVRILKYVAQGPYQEDYFSCDYCIYCGTKIGNVELTLKAGVPEVKLHTKDCLFILASDMLTGIEPND